MIRRADIDWTGIVWLAIVTAFALAFCVAFPAHAQERGRAVRPDAFHQHIRSDVSFTRPLTAADLENLVVIIAPSGVRASDEISTDGHVSVKMLRRRRQPDGQTNVCVVKLIPLDASDYTQWFAYQPMKWSVPVREGDQIGFEWRGEYDVFVPLAGESATCVMCARWHDEKLAPLRGFAVPNGGCQ